MNQHARRFLVLACVLAASSAAAGERFEIAGHAGFTFPFYSQSFHYDPGAVSVPIPGVSVQQSGDFELRASGGPAFAGAVTIDTQGGSYAVRVGLPAPFDPVVANLNLTQGTADLKALTPLSFNLKLRTGGSVRFTASGGPSKLGNIEMNLSQSVGLGVIGFDFVQGSAQIATIGLRATAAGETGSSWGGNLGLGLEIPIGEHGAFLIEGRGFYFPKRTVEWAPVVDRPLTQIEQLLLQRLQERLDPVEFEPWWVQTTIGFAVRF